MTMITILEVRTPLENPGPHNANVESDLMFVGSTREKVMAFIAERAARPDYRRDNAWCWCVYDVILDDPRTIPHNLIVVGRDGQTYACQQDAWDACLPVSAGPS